jgi:hypothetical protein
MLPNINFAFGGLCNQQSSNALMSIMVQLALMAQQLPPMDYDGEAMKSVNAQLAAMAAQEAELARRMADPTVQIPRFPLTSYTGVYSHPAYGTVNVSLAADSKSLLGEFTNLRRTRAEQTFPFIHMWQETFGLQFGAPFDVTIPFEFQNDGFSTVVAAASVLEAAVPPIFFTSSRYATNALGFNWPSGCVPPKVAPPPQPIIINNTTTNTIYINNGSNINAADALVTRGDIWSIVTLTVSLTSLIVGVVVYGLWTCVFAKRRTGNAAMTSADPLLTSYT